LDKLKIKQLTEEQILISLDRLTRFKNPETRYRRVFYDLITANLIEPKLKKSELENMKSSDLTVLAQTVLNFSIKTLIADVQPDFTINQRIYDYEKSVFNLSEDAQNLINNRINYNAAIRLIGGNAPDNLRWLKFLGKNSDIKQCREKYSLGTPVEKIIIAEGVTEETLLPVFGRFCGCDFDREGIKIIPAGGKNQVVKLYYELSETVKLPIFVLLDSDAKENLEQIKPKLRTQDKIHLVKCGEFEDLLPPELIKKTLEYELSNISTLETGMLNSDMPHVKVLEEVFKTRGRHEFKKAEFARMVKENINSDKDISPEIAQIINEITNS